MDRREFLKTCAALGVTVSIPGFVPGDAIQFTDYYVDDRRLGDALTIGRITVRDGRGWVECSIDTAVMWNAVTLEDSESRIWTTADGERWECGDLWFEVDGEGFGGY